jgi:gamma-glutamyl:cysteine ligase YbdK (ATP-grasp superfamily)
VAEDEVDQMLEARVQVRLSAQLLARVEVRVVDVAVQPNQTLEDARNLALEMGRELGA